MYAHIELPALLLCEAYSSLAFGHFPFGFREEMTSLPNLRAELLSLEPSWSVLICTRCQYALVPGAVAAHLSSHHSDIITGTQAKGYAETWKAVPLQPPKLVQLQHIPSTTPPIRHLCLYDDGLAAASAGLHLPVTGRDAAPPPHRTQLAKPSKKRPSVSSSQAG